MVKVLLLLGGVAILLVSEVDPVLLDTRTSLGLTIPETLLATADEVIQ
jgi:hypothetical protein